MRWGRKEIPKRWFAWHPVRCQDAYVRWLEFVWRRRIWTGRAYRWHYAVTQDIDTSFEWRNHDDEKRAPR